METIVELVILLLLIAVGTAIVTKRFKVPYSVALVVVGLGLAGIRQLKPDIFPEGFAVEPSTLTPELILILFLPPLLFEGALAVDIAVLRRNAPRVLLLAAPGTFTNWLAMGAVLHYVFSMPWLYGLLLASIIVATDPVSVLALFRSQGVNHDLSFTVEGESISNDGIAVVLFIILSELAAKSIGVEAAGGEHVIEASAAVAEGAKLFAYEVGVAIGLGLGLGYLSHRLLGTMDEPLTEVAISIVLAWGVYCLAVVVHASGVVAVAAAGLVIGNFGKMFSMSPSTRMTLTTFWEVVAFLMNSLLFLLMGAAVDMEALWSNLGIAAAIFACLVLVRAIVTYGYMFLLKPTRWAVPVPWMHVIHWGGVRGSIPIALALGLPVGLSIPVGDGVVITRDDLIAAVFGVVLLSLFTQGLTIGPLVSWLGLAHRDATRDRFERLQAREAAMRAAADALDELVRRGETTNQIRDHIRASMAEERATVGKLVRDMLADNPGLHRAEEEQALRAAWLAARAALEDVRRRGVISAEAVEHEVIEIDARLVLLETGATAVQHDGDESPAPMASPPPDPAPPPPPPPAPAPAPAPEPEPTPAPGPEPEPDPEPAAPAETKPALPDPEAADHVERTGDFNDAQTEVMGRPPLPAPPPREDRPPLGGPPPPENKPEDKGLSEGLNEGLPSEGELWPDEDGKS